jgi:hypothetical protein
MGGQESPGILPPNPGARAFFCAVKIEWGGWMPMQGPPDKNSTWLAVDKINGVSRKLPNGMNRLHGLQIIANSRLI